MSYMPRRNHRKSRNGCVQCKARRVKCTEDGPPCKNCVSRAINCSYAAQQTQCLAPLQAEDSMIPTAYRTGREQEQPPTVQSCSAATARKHLFELELMHQYTSDTWQTLCHNHRQSDQRQTEEHKYLLRTIPQQALSHEFARHALFALAALHLASLQGESTTRFKYVRAALQYQSWAQAGFTTAMNTLAESHAEVLVSTSLAFSILAVSVPRYLDASLGPSQDDPLDNILSAHRLFCGPYKILSGACVTANLVPLAILLSPKDMSCFDECEAETRDALHRLRSISIKRYPTTSGVYPGTYCPDMIDELEWAFRRFLSGNMTVAFGWLISIPEGYIEDLTEQEPSAVLLFMHWCVLLHWTSGLWWVPNTGPELISQLATSLREEPHWTSDSPEAAAVAWCCQKGGVEQQH